jgi:hypothetical protein
MAKSCINLDAIKAMVDAGATDAVIASTVRAMVSVDMPLAERRRKDRERKRVKQASRRVLEQASETPTAEFHAEFHAENARNMRNSADDSPLTSFLEEERKKETAAAAARAREVEISDRVALLCPDIIRTPDDPDVVARWLADGFTEHFILAVARQVMARRRPPIVRRITYFEPALIEERERQRQKILPLAGAPHLITENKDVIRPTAGSYQASRDDFRAARAELKERIREGGGGGG